MEIKVQVTPKDFADAFRTHYARNALRKWWFIAIRGIVLLMLGAVLLGIMLSPYREWTAQFLPLAIVMTIWVILLWAGLPYFAKRRWKKTPAAKYEQTFTFTEDGYACRTEVSEGRAEWKLLVQWTESKNSFLLYPGPCSFIPIPKRVFAPEQVEEFRALLARHVKHA